MANLTYEGEVQTPVNVLADRYASPDMVKIFSEKGKVFMERGLWIAVMREQARLGLDIPNDAIDAYETVQGEIDLDSIREREKVTNHDVKARIEEFNALAGYEYAHTGMTSRDLTENIEQLQNLQGLDIITARIVATLARFSMRALEHQTLPMAGRSHNVAAQVTTLGKRFANYGEELFDGHRRIVELRNSYSLRGIKGPMGTQQDMLDLFEGDAGKVEALEAAIAAELGFSDTLGSVGQVFPRSMDFDVVSALKQATNGPVNFATTLRLMAGYELATEGFKSGQVGSSAMPHKMNAAKSERINSLSAVLTGHVAMAAEVSSRQWNEGDVSCSAVRRVYQPDSFFAADGIFQMTMTILDRFGAYPAVIERELERYLPFLATTKVLMAAAKAGVGRETAHEVIKEHATTVALDMREKGITENDLLDRLAADPRLGIAKDTLGNVLTNPLELSGLATQQVAHFADQVKALVDQNPEAVTYTPTVAV